MQVNKDDLLSMVRYGAELVFSSEATNITGGQPLFVSLGCKQHDRYGGVYMLCDRTVGTPSPTAGALHG